MGTPQGAHLVGSINLNTAEEVIGLVTQELGTHVRRIPDGEVGERFHWIAFQAQRLAQTDGISQVGEPGYEVRGVDFRPVALDAGVDPQQLTIAPLGYAEAAIASYDVFRRLKAEGNVPEHVRFQVSLPTPVGVVASFVVAEDRERFEPVYEQALYRELQEILDHIPHDELAIQWDAAIEFAFIEEAGYRGNILRPWYEDAWQGSVERLVKHLNRVPEPVEVGVHLCYGDVGEAHFVEPEDTGNLVRFANDLIAGLTRPLTWIHLPVPIERDDIEYVAPLTGLRAAADTELYLGLIHREDGVQGAKRRIAAAKEVLTRNFGVSTECGFGRSPEGTTVPLFETHREVAEAW